jgi:hypothetical protein
MLRRVALVRTDVLEKRSASIIRVTRIGELGTTRNIPKDNFLHSRRRENLKSYIEFAEWVLYRRCNVFPVR